MRFTFHDKYNIPPIGVQAKRTLYTLDGCSVVLVTGYQVYIMYGLEDSYLRYL